MNQVQKNLNQKSYNDGHTFGFFWGWIVGVLVGVFFTYLVMSFVF